MIGTKQKIGRGCLPMEVYQDTMGLDQGVYLIEKSIGNFLYL
jgi:hypothetical protein